MKVLSLFSGIGAFEKALVNLGIPYELVAYCEIDKYASKSYAAIHSVSESLNLGDITKVDEKKLPKDLDLITYGFPCQDISLAGKQKGLFNADGTQTRSGLFFEALRIIEETQPKVAIAENVKNLTSKKFAVQFKIVLDSLKAAGYNNYWKVLNAKDFGIPQNRERVFIVSIRKDIDNGNFKFPEGFPLELRLKNLMENDVDEKYYLSDKAVEKITRFGNKIISNQNPNVSGTIHAGYYKMGGRDQQYVKDTAKCIQVADLNHYQNDQMNRVYSGEGICPAVLTKTGGGRETKIAVETERIINVCNVNPSGKGMNGNVIDEEGLSATLTTNKGEGLKILVREGHMNFEPNVLRSVRTEYGKSIRKAYENGEVQENRRNMTELQPRTDGISNTITTVQKDNFLHDGCLRIRKLTPKECFRLMGFDDADFEKAEAVNSNTQLYKQAGNSIVVPVVQHITKALFDCGVLQK